MAKDTLVAREMRDGWAVEDTDGGIWWPNDEARARIEKAKNPARMVLRLCRHSPIECGRWHQ